MPLAPFALACLLPAVAAASEGPDARLDRLIAASQLDRAALAALALTDPATTFQVLDQESRAALDLLLALPPSEIRRVRDGQAVIRTSREWSDAEWYAMLRLADHLGTNPRKVTQVRATVMGGELVRVELAGKRATTGVGLAWPLGWRRAEVVETLREELGVTLPRAPVALVDASFEDEHALGVAWVVDQPAGTRVLRDTARAKAGTVSMRLERDKGARVSPRVSQRLDVAPGDRLVLSAEAARDGDAVLVANLAFEVPGLGVTVADVWTKEQASGDWERLTVSAVVPQGATRAWAWFELSRPGAANVDDLVLAVDTGEPSPVSAWQPTTRGAIEVRADLARVRDPGAVAGQLEWALLAGLGNLSISPIGRATVYVYADEAHRGAVPGGRDDVAAGECWIVAGSTWSGACPVAVMLTRAWGPAGNPVLGVGLPRALAGSGADLDAATRPGLDGVPRIGALASTWGDTPAEVAAATSFAAWLLETQSLAGVRAAWLATPLDGYTVAGRDLGALDAAWRTKVGP
ncbi:MAG: hypothetical protein Q8P41_27125 [Pseudomonadota bacterium]|nr:hypothetical protein [Pseudomonadota bacterium]